MPEMLGANLEDLARLSHDFARGAQTIVQLRSEVERLMSAPWAGHNAEMFRQAWSGVHRAKLQAAIDGLNEAAANVDRQRADQAKASGVSGTAGGAGIGGSSAAVSAGGSFGERLAGISDTGTPFFALAGGLGWATGIGALGSAGKGFGIFSAFTSGVGIGEDIAQHRYVDAGLDGTFAAGDIAAGALKESGTPISYGGGVALQAWVEVGRAAQEVNWSSKGMQELQQASLGDWGSGFVYAMKRMPLESIKIFSPW